MALAQSFVLIDLPVRFRVYSSSFE